MKKLRTIRAPFPIEYSSCSKFKPENFEWSSSDGIATVWIDSNILAYKGNKAGNFGWLCESSEILPHIKDYLMNNSGILKNHFQNIFTSDSEIIKADPNLFLFNPSGSNLPWIPKADYRIPQKNKVVSMLCSSKDMTIGHKLRLSVAKEINEQIDLYGGAHGSPRSGGGAGPNGDWWRSKETALTPYMFSFVFENSSYDGYYTEKITDCFALGVIPIYWGDPTIGKTFNLDGIIKWNSGLNLDLLNENLYNSRMWAIKENLEIVSNLKSADDILYKQIIKLI